MRVEHTRGLNGADSIGNQPDSFRVSAFAEVWHTFHQAAGSHRVILRQDYRIYRIHKILVSSSTVPPNRFISQRKNAWQRLEDLLKLLDTASLQRLGREE